METKVKLKNLARNGNADKLKKFLTQTNVRVISQRINEAVDDKTGATPLIECVKSAKNSTCRPGDGFGLCCRYFTKCGGNMNYRDKSDRTCLHWAVINKNHSLTTILVGLGADCKFRDKDGLNPFHLAVKTGTKDCVNNILKLHPEFVNVQDASGIPPVIMSLQKGDYDMCKLLITEGADINIQETRSQRTALYYCLFLKQLSLFEDMIKSANMNLFDHRLTTIIHRCCAEPEPIYLSTVFKINPKIPLFILNMVDAEGATALITSCQNGHYEHLEMLVNRGASVSIRDKCKRTALHHCADNFDTRCAELLLKIDPTVLNMEDHEGLTTLHLAVITGNIPFIKLLLKAGANMTCQDYAKHTVAHWATVRGLSEVLGILMDYGADIYTPDAHNAYPLHYAAQNVHNNPELDAKENGKEVLRMLIEHDSPVNAADDDGRTPLIWAASSGNADACRMFVDAGADVEAVDNHGLTALHCAASRGHSNTIRCLVSDCKVHVDVVDKAHCTALLYAITLGNMECMKLLIELGANLTHLDIRGRTPAHCAAVKGSVEALDFLYKRNVNLWKASTKGDFPIHEAAQAGHVDAVDYIVKNKSSTDHIDIINKEGRSCLHIAALTNNVWLSKYLIDSGANINLIMKHKGKYYTPYDAAVAKGNHESAEYIKSKGGVEGETITHQAARLIQKNLRTKYGRPKSSKHLRPKSPNPRKKSLSPTPYSKERRSSFRHDDSNSERSPSRLTVGHLDDNRSRKSSVASSTNDMGSNTSKTQEKDRSPSPVPVASTPVPIHKTGRSVSPSPERTQKKEAEPQTNQTKPTVSKTRRNSSGSCDSGQKVKQSYRKSKLIEDVQASVKRYETERKYIRELHQMRRAQLYMGPMYDIGLYKHMLNNSYQPKTSNGAKADKDSLQSLSQWDEFVEDQCKFVSHIHQDNKPSFRRVRSAAQRQHRKLKSDANSAKKTTEKRCKKLEEKAQEKQAKLETDRQQQEKNLEQVLRRTEELYNETNNKADESIKVAQQTNHTEEERIQQELQKHSKSSGPQRKTDDMLVTSFEVEEKERRETYKQWQKRKAEELRKRLTLAYGPYLPPGLFSEDRKSLDAAIRSNSSGRPVTSFSYNSVNSRPLSTFSKREPRQTRLIMTAYGSRKLVTDNGLKETQPYIPNGTARPRNPLIFVPQSEYEAKVKDRKDKEKSFIQQRNQSVETCA